MADLQRSLDGGLYGYAATTATTTTAEPEIDEFGQLKIYPQGLDTYYISPISSPVSPHQQYLPVVSAPPPPGVLINGPAVLGDFGALERIDPVVGTDPLIGNLVPAASLLQSTIASSPDLLRKAKLHLKGFSTCRRILRDGNCAWRALAFGYFEALTKTGNHALIVQEQERFKELNGILAEQGLERFGYEIFANATATIFDTLLASSLSDEYFEATTVLASFLDQRLSDSIVTHFKLLTAAWVRKCGDYYAGIVGNPVAFCEKQIEPFGVELDLVGFNVAVDCILSNSSIACDIVICINGFNGQVDTQPAGTQNPLLQPRGNTFRVLCRADGFDVLYADGDLSPSPASIPLPLSPICTIPPPLSPVSATIYPPHPEEYFPHIDEVNNYSPTAPLSPTSPSNFRPSMFQLPEFQPTPLPTVPFQTPTFKNSPFNPSHFQSANFQPEMYQPELDSP